MNERRRREENARKRVTKAAAQRIAREQFCLRFINGPLRNPNLIDDALVKKALLLRPEVLLPWRQYQGIRHGGAYCGFHVADTLTVVGERVLRSPGWWRKSASYAQVKRNLDELVALCAEIAMMLS